MRRTILASVAFGLGLTGMVALAAFWYTRPTVLKVAVTRGSEDAQLITAIAQSLGKDHDDVRLRALLVNDASAAAAALEAEQADMAVVRTDVRLPPNGQTLVLLHRNPAILLTTRGAHVAHISDLRGKSVGVVRGPATASGNTRLLESILNQYELTTNDVQIVDLGRDEVLDAVATGKAAAVLAVGALNSQTLRDIVAAVTQAGKGDPVFVPITEAKAMALRSPVFESIDVVRGTFGGAPPKPAEAFETLGVSVRLMATSAMNDSVAADITRLLFANRTAIAQISPLANQIEAPSTARGAIIPVHPGAAAFLDDEEKSFFDHYSDVIYIGAMVLSVLGSAAAAAASRLSGGGRGAAGDKLLLRLREVLRRARSADSAAALDELENETDEILISGIANRRANTLDAEAIGALTLALDQARLAIKDRRRALQLPARAEGGGAVVRTLPRDTRSINAG
jgi:TRAP transporter TAXI family solute receptor